MIGQKTYLVDWKPEVLIHNHSISKIYLLIHLSCHELIASNHWKLFCWERKNGTICCCLNEKEPKALDWFIYLASDHIKQLQILTMHSSSWNFPFIWLSYDISPKIIRPPSSPIHHYSIISYLGPTPEISFIHFSCQYSRTTFQCNHVM